MATELETAVWRALRTVVDPCSIATGVPIDLVDMGLIRSMRLDGRSVDVELRLTSPICWQSSNIREAIREALAEVGLTDVTVRVDHGAEWLPDMMAPAARERLRRLRPLRSRTETPARA